MESSMGGGGSSPKSPGGGNAGMEKSAAMSIIINLEKEKLRIASQITRDERTVEDLEKHVMFLQANVLGQRAKLGSYNSLFMRMSDADQKAPRQRLGAREAVLGTKRIIDKELNRLENEVVVSEMKLNRSRERNQLIRERINQLRREGVTYRSLFEKMKAELADLKSSIGLVDRAVDGEYSSRDRAFEDMRELAKQFQLDKQERLAAFASVSEDLDALPATTVAPPDSPKDKKPGAAGGKDGNGANGGEDNALRKRVAKAQAKLSKDRYAIELAQRKLQVFSNALRRVKAATGYNKTTEVTAIFNRYEEEKFQRAQLAQRLMVEIESLEASVAAMHEEVLAREEENAKLKAQRAAQIEALQKAATEREKDWRETDSSMQRTVSEVRALYRVIEFAFYALGIRSAMDEVNGKPFVNPLSTTVLGSPTGMLGSPGGDSSATSHLDGAFGGVSSPRGPTGRLSIAAMSPNSPTRQSMFGPAGASPEGSARQHRQRSLSMYAGDARTRHAVRSGVSASSLGAFMGTIENKSAEVIQQYAAVMTKLASGELQAAALRNTLEEAEHQQSLRGKGGIKEEDDDSDLEPDDAVAAAAAAVQARRQANSFAAGSGEMARKLLQNPSVLGPANPPGRVKEAITASALMASLAVDSARMAGELDSGIPSGATGPVPGANAAAAAAAAAAAGLGVGAGGGPEDDSKLLSVEELKQQALRRLNNDKNIQALKSAAAAAANVLVSTATNNILGSSGGAGGGNKGNARNIASGKVRE